MDESRKERRSTKHSRKPVASVALRLILIVVLSGLMAGLFLLQASEIAVTARRVETLRQKRDDLQRDNAELLDQIAGEGSLPQLQERAARLGFVPATQVEYLRVSFVPYDAALTLREQWSKQR